MGQSQLAGVKKIILLIKKDLLVEFRRMYEIISVLAFPIISSLTFTYVYQEKSPYAPLAFLWIIVVLSTLFIATTSFMREHDRKTLYGIRLLPISPSYIFLSKCGYTFIIVLLVSLSTMGLIAAFMGFPQVNLLTLIVSLLLFVANLSVIASFVSALVMHSEGKIILLPFITFLYSFPVLLLTASASIKMLYGLNPLMEFATLLSHLAFFLLVSLLVLSYIIEE